MCLKFSLLINIYTHFFFYYFVEQKYKDLDGEVIRKNGIILLRELTAEVKNFMDFKMNAVLVSAEILKSRFLLLLMLMLLLLFCVCTLYAVRCTYNVYAKCMLNVTYTSSSVSPSYYLLICM